MLVSVRGLGETCRALREATAWSQAEGAMRCSVSTGAWQQWEEKTGGSLVRIQEHSAEKLKELYEQYVGNSLLLIVL